MVTGKIREPWLRAEMDREQQDAFLRAKDALPFEGPIVYVRKQLARRRKIMALHRRTHV